MLRRFLAVALSLIATAAAATEFILYTYHDKAPYYLHAEGNVVTPTGGLYVEWANILNSRQKEFQFKVVFLPRLRLDKGLEDATLNGAVIGVNPLWFKDVKQTKYLWSVPLMKDSDVVIVRKGAEFPYQHPRDLAGKTMALSRGYYWWGVTEMVAEGKIQLQETDGDASNFRMVLTQRVNATISSILSFKYLSSDLAVRDSLTTLPTPHDQFERMVLLPRPFEAQHKLINRMIRDPDVSKAWLALLKKFGYEI